MTAPTDHHKIWLTILNQLQEEMPPASFDTWVRDSDALFLVDKVLTVSVRNAYARDWLTNRLKDTVARMLSGIVGDQAEVVFVTTAGEETVDVDSQDDSEADKLDAKDPETIAPSTCRATSAAG
jgi:chromosomal replication initiation ATPase DnaA